MAKMCCDSRTIAVVSGHSGSRSCHCAVDIVGVIGTFLLPKLASFPMRIPVQLSVLSANDTMTSLVTSFILWRLVVEVTSKAPSPSVISRHHFVLASFPSTQRNRSLFDCNFFGHSKVQFFRSLSCFLCKCCNYLLCLLIFYCSFSK